MPDTLLDVIDAGLTAALPLNTKRRIDRMLALGSNPRRIVNNYRRVYGKKAHAETIILAIQSYLQRLRPQAAPVCDDSLQVHVRYRDLWAHCKLAILPGGEPQLVRIPSEIAMPRDAGRVSILYHLDRLADAQALHDLIRMAGFTNVIVVPKQS